MNEPDLHAVGFDFEDWSALLTAVDEAGLLVVDAQPVADVVGTYTDPSGARLVYLDCGADDRFTQVALASDATFHAEVFQIRPGLGMLDVKEGGETTYRFLADLDDAHAYPVAGSQATIVDSFHLSLVGYEVWVYRDEAEWKGAQGVSEQAVRLGKKHIISPWLFAVYAGQAQPEEATSATQFSGELVTVDKRVNQLTGIPFYWCTVDCGITLPLALPGDISPAPEPGFLVAGTVLVAGSSGGWDAIAPGATPR